MKTRINNLFPIVFSLSSIALLAIIVLLAITTLTNSSSLAQEKTKKPVKNTIANVMEKFNADKEAPQDLQRMAYTACVNGFAGSYPCNNVDLMSFLPLADIGGGNGNDIWGWTDSTTGKEYAIMGRTTGTAFVDISDPVNPIYLGNLPTHTSSSNWRDIKVYADHAFIVSEASSHGMQIFDLTQLRNVSNPPATFSNTAHFSGFGSAHNIVINEDSGYAYGVGATTCSGGLHMVNIQNPTSPVDAGCFSADGYTHDAQCVIYNGPDTTYQGSEICVNSNEDTVTIVDVTTKSSPTQLSRVSYTGAEYTHQGWLTEDHKYFLLNDELDEQRNGHNTRTYIWDVTDLNNPTQIGVFVGALPNIDHNLYVKGNLVYQSHYRAGLRILDISGISTANLSEVAYFDIYPSSDSAAFNGSWSNYPYFASGNVIVSGIEQGLFVVKPTLENLTITKTANPDPATAGGVLNYTLTVLNDTSNTLTGVTITDDVPANTTYVAGSASDGGSESAGTVTFPAVTLTSGQSVVRTFQVLVDAGFGSTIFFSDDMESGSSNWTATHGSGSSDWSLGTTNPHGGSYAWFAQDVGSTSDQYLAFASAVALSGNPTLRVWHNYNTESGYDGGAMEISTNGGSTWSDLGSLITQNGYNGSISSSYGNPIGGRSAFTGNSGGYVETLVNLSSYSGQNVLIRFRLGTDSSVAGTGWYVDDVELLTEAAVTNTACVNSTQGESDCDTITTNVINNGSPTPTPTTGPTNTPTSPPPPTNTPTPTPTAGPTNTPTNTPVPTNTPTPTATPSTNIFFEDDMESGSGNWTATHGSGSYDWNHGIYTAHSGSYAWFAQDVSSISDQYLTLTNPVAISGNASLSVWHYYNTENRYDGGVIEISTNGGSTWTDLGSLMTQNGYNQTISSSYSNPIGGRNAFSGNSSGYIQTLVDLSSYSGQSIQIRFRMATDSSVSSTGWYVDDVKISDETTTLCRSATSFCQDNSPISGEPGLKTFYTYLPLAFK